MADVNISYKGSSIATMDESGSKTLNTQGKYCEDNITVQYTDPEKPTQTKSVTPSESAQAVTPDSGKVLSSVSVSAIPSNYVGTAVTRKAAATYTPTTTDQTIAASQYLTGAQTVKGDANLVAANIKEGVSIFGVQGTHSGGTPVNFAEVTYTMPSNKVNTSFTVACECNFTPKVIICLTEGAMSSSQNVMGMVKSDYVQFAVRGTTTNYYVGGGTSYGDISYSNGVITVTSSNSNMVFRSGYKFHFYLIG